MYSWLLIIQYVPSIVLNGGIVYYQFSGGREGGGESPVSRKWVAAYRIVPEDDAMNSHWGHNEKLPRKGDIQAGFWSVNRSLTNKIRMCMCIKVIWVLATWWGDFMILYNGKNAGQKIEKHTEWFVHSDFWTSHSTSLSCRPFCESILKKKTIPDKPKEIILSQDWHFYPHSFITRVPMIPIWNSRFLPCPLCSPKSSFFPFHEAFQSWFSLNTACSLRNEI